MADNEALAPDVAIEPRALLEALLAAAPVGLGFLDRDLRFVRVNAALASIHGLARPQHLGQAYADVWPGIPSDLVDGLAGVLEEGIPVIDYEARLGSENGDTRRDVLASYYPVRGQSGEIVGVGTVVVDITERTASEEALQRYAQATTVEIQVSTDERAAVLRVHDDGAGGAEPRDGGGLQGLADRVEALGGQLTVASRSGLGTTLGAHVPLMAPHAGGRS